MDIDHTKLPEPYRTNMRVWKETDAWCKRLPPLKNPSVKIAHADFETCQKRFDKTTIEVWPVDTLKAAQRLWVEEGPTPAVLNMADDGMPMGNVHVGSTCQEESLCRSTTLSKHLDIRLYPIRDDEVILSQDVVVFRDSAENGYKLLERPFEITVVSCAGIRHPKLTADGHLTPTDARRLKRKIQTVFRAAAQTHTTLVLGALGCGAWRNPPEDVARVFREVCEEYDGAFKRVVFAILPRGATGLFAPHEPADRGCNLDVFTRVLLGD